MNDAVTLRIKGRVLPRWVRDRSRRLLWNCAQSNLRVGRSTAETLARVQGAWLALVDTEQLSPFDEAAFPELLAPAAGLALALAPRGRI